MSLTKSKKISGELMDLLEREDTTAEEFEQKMDALRRSRLKDIEEQELERQLSEVRQELRELLTPRQKAAELLFVDRLLWKYLLLRYNGCMHHAN